MSKALVIVAGAVLVALLAVRRRYTVAVVRGHSMSPTLTDGQRVLAARRRGYRVGDVVVFRAPAHRADGPEWRIKRVVAVAGQHCPWPDLPPVPAAHLAVAGDGVRSEDSRQLGFIPLTSVAGRMRT